MSDTFDKIMKLVRKAEKETCQIVKVPIDLLKEAGHEVENVAIELYEAKHDLEELRWIPIEEWLPKRGTSILAICKDQHGNANGMIVEWISENGVWHPLPFEYFSHWMPLPQPPKEGDGE